MIRLIITLLIMSGINSSISGQSVISGRIVDENNQSLESVNVLVLNRVDSSYVSGTTTNQNGNFTISVPNQINNILSFSMIGYKTLYISKKFDNDSIIIGDISLKEDTHLLSTVTVEARRKAIKLEAGKTIINLSSTIFGSQGSVFDALRTLPGVFVKEDGTIILNGQSGVNLLVNGRSVYLSGENLTSLLKSTPASSVDKIELITSPSAKYDASGKAGLINIKLNKSPFEGISASFNINYKYGKNSREYGGGRLAYHSNKLSVTADYWHYQGTSENNLTIFREYLPINNESTVNQAMSQHSFTKYADKNNYLRLAVDYDISKKITVGYYATGIINTRTMPAVNKSSFNLLNMAVDSTLFTNSQNRIQQNTLSGGFFAEYKDSLKREIDFSADYLLYNHKEIVNMGSERMIEGEPLIKKDSLTGNLKGHIGMFSAQGNFSIPLSNKATFKSGAKATWVNIENTAIYDSFLQKSSDNKNTYSENINAAYIQMEAKFGNFSANTGIRLENTNIQGDYFSTEPVKRDSSYTQSYTNIFPSIMFLYNFSDDKNSVSLVYNKRITRPNYRDMLPFNQIWDRYTSSRGNPELKAELTDNFEFIHIYKKTYRTTLFIVKINNAFSQNYLVKDDNSIVVFPDNITSRFGYGLKFDSGNFLNLKWWQPSINFSYFRANSSWNEMGVQKKNGLFTYNVNFNNQFYFGKGWSAELSGFHNGKMTIAQTTTLPFGNLSVAVQKRLFNDKASIKLFGEDILASVHDNLSIDFFNMRARTSSVNDSRAIGISFSYNFTSKSPDRKSSRERKIDESKRINL